MTASAIYEGTVATAGRDRSSTPSASGVAAAWLDLDEAESCSPIPLCSARRPAPLRCRRSDHFGDPHRASPSAPATWCEARVGAPAGRAGAACWPSPRYLGMGYNPVSFFFLHDEEGQRPGSDRRGDQHPWGERCHYVLDGGAGRRAAARPLRQGDARLPVHADGPGLRLAVGEPGRGLGLRIANTEGDREVFAASLALRRRRCDRRNLARAVHRPAAAALRARAHLRPGAAAEAARAPGHHSAPATGAA